MSNKKKAAGTRGRHIPQHRKDPFWTVGDLPTMPGGLGAKIVIAGVAGASLAIPATSAFASPSSIAKRPGSPLITFGHQRTQHQGTQHQGTDRDQATEQPRSQHMRHSPLQPTAGQTGNGATGGSVSMQQAGGTVAPSNSADSASQGPGLLLEPDGTFATLPPSASNVQTVPAGSLIITSDGAMITLSAGSYVTPYGLITASQAPGGGAPSTGPAMSGTTSVNPGGPMQTPPQQPAPAPATTPVPAPVMTPGPAPVMGGVTVADNGTVTPNGSVNLAFPGSGIGGSLPLSLPSAAAAQPTQPAFPPADQNVALADPIFQSLIQNLGQQAQPPVSLPAPIPDLSPSTVPGTAPANPNAIPSNAVRLASLDNGVLSDAPPPGRLQLGQAGQPNSLTVILPDGTPQTFPLGTSTNPLAPPTFGQGNEILVPLGTQVPLPNGGSTTLDSPGTLTLPNSGLPAIHAVPAMPTSDNSPAGTTTVAMNNVDPQTGAPIANDANGSPAGGGVAPAPAPAPVATLAPAPADTTPAPAPATTPAPAPADVAPAPAPAPVTVASSGGFTTSDPSTVGDPVGVVSAPSSGFGRGSGFGGGS